MIAVITAMYNRPEVSRIFAEGINRLKATGIPIQVFAAISEADSLAICNEYGFIPVFSQNRPLGNKWNAVFNEAALSKPDGILILGDDDLISDNYFLWLCNFTTSSVGLSNFGIVNCETKEALHFKYAQNKTIGAGRWIPASVLEKLRMKVAVKRNSERIHMNEYEAELMNRDGSAFTIPSLDYFTPYDGTLDSSLDLSLEMALANKRETFRVFNDGMIHCIDLKTKKNIWSFNRFKEMNDFSFTTSPITFDEATWFCSENELELIRLLEKAKTDGLH